MSANNLVTMSISGLSNVLMNINTLPKRMVKKITPEVREIGNTMLDDVRAVTPVITGQLKRSAYTEMGEPDPALIAGAVGYTAPYSTEIEFRHQMLSNTLNEWNVEIRERIIKAGFQALEDFEG